MAARTGAYNHFSKLTSRDVKAIRARYSAREASLSQLATEYRVTSQNIWSVVTRRTWKSVH